MTVKNPVANKINFLGTLETSQRAELQKCFMILQILASFLQCKCTNFTNAMNTLQL